AQFWAFTNDVYTAEQGQRLFAIIGIGSSLGAILGSQLASRLFVSLGPYFMMLVAAAVLLVCMSITSCINQREQRAAGSICCEPLKSGEGLLLIFRRRYLLFIGLLILLSNIVNTTGEYILGKSVIEQASRILASAANRSAQQEYIGTFYAQFYFWTNL